jgi:crotonobetainyl-CoA:carnitine CoA-transferase CaiB-like acyl-CoA transferase
VDHPVAGQLQLPGLPWQFSATPADALRPAPTLGQHNEKVFKELLGLEPTDLARLQAEGTI